MMELTVGLPVYNAMPFLQESVESLLAQTDSDFQILAVDDGSTDSGLEYLRSVRDARLCVLTQPNRGLTFTLNRMLHEVSTPWMMRHDADDVAMPDRVAATKRAIRQFPNAAMFYAEALYHRDGAGMGSFRTTRATPEELREIVTSGYLPSICHPTVTLKVAAALAAGGYRFDLHVEDLDLWWRMVLGYEVRYIPEVTTHFRHNASSVSSRNLMTQAVNALYVQYLLLSHLHGWPPLSYDQVLPRLSSYVNPRTLSFREQMRMANIHLGQKVYWKALLYVCRAFVASPQAFLRRVSDEMRSGSAVTNGEDPRKFLRDQAYLWPAGLGSTGVEERSEADTSGISRSSKAMRP